MSNTYTVRMIQGIDTCKTITTVEANGAEEAAIVAQFKWTGMTVRVVNVELAGECMYDEVNCDYEEHYCPTCETHLENDGKCTNCHY